MLASRVSFSGTVLRLRTARPCASRALSVSPSAMAMATPKLKLTYFNIKARAEPTRLALHIAGIPFEDVRLKHEEWPALKGSFPLGQVPVRSACSCALRAPLRASPRAPLRACARRAVPPRRCLRHF